MPKFKDFLFGKRDKLKQVGTLTPEQQNLNDLILQAITNNEGPLKELFGKFDPESFNKGVKEPALKEFQDTVLPQLQERYISNNAFKGSSFRNAALKSSEDLSSKLAQLLYEAQQKHQSQQTNAINNFQSQRQFENVNQPGYEGFAQGLLKILGGEVAGATGKAVSNGMSSNTPNTSNTYNNVGSTVAQAAVKGAMIG